MTLFKLYILSVQYLPNMVLGCAVKMEGSTTKRVLSTIKVTLSEVLMFRFPAAALAPPSLGFSYTKTISPTAKLLKVPSVLDKLLLRLLTTPLLLEPLGETL